MEHELHSSKIGKVQVLESQHVSSISNKFERGLFTLDEEEYSPGDEVTYYRGVVKDEVNTTPAERIYSIQINAAQVLVANPTDTKNLKYVGHLCNHQKKEKLGHGKNNCTMVKVNGKNMFVLVIDKLIKGSIELFWDYQRSSVTVECGTLICQTNIVGIGCMRYGYVVKEVVEVIVKKKQSDNCFRVTGGDTYKSQQGLHQEFRVSNSKEAAKEWCDMMKDNSIPNHEIMGVSEVLTLDDVRLVSGKCEEARGTLEHILPKQLKKH